MLSIALLTLSCPRRRYRTHLRSETSLTCCGIRDGGRVKSISPEDARIFGTGLRAKPLRVPGIARHCSWPLAIASSSTTRHSFRDRRAGAGGCAESILACAASVAVRVMTPSQDSRRRSKKSSLTWLVDVPMNRLLQGDVGSGKTDRSRFMPCWPVVAHGGQQAVMMAPTESSGPAARSDFRTPCSRRCSKVPASRLALVGRADRLRKGRTSVTRKRNWKLGRNRHRR